MTNDIDIYIPLDDQRLEKIAWKALIKVQGDPYNWTHSNKVTARKVLRILKDTWLKDISVAKIKKSVEDIKGQTYTHRIFYELFNLMFEDHLYQAPDAELFEKTMPYLQQLKDPQKIIFAHKFKDFDHLVFTVYSNQYYFIRILPENEFLRPFLTDYFMHHKLTSPFILSQKLADIFVGVIDQAVNDKGISSISEFDAELFFCMLATAKNSQDSDFMLRHVVHLYRYGITQKVFDFTWRGIDQSILHSRETVTFFSKQFINRDSTFYFLSNETTSPKFITVVSENTYVKDIYGRYLGSSPHNSYAVRVCTDELDESLGPLIKIIDADHPFDETALMTQLDYFRRHYAPGQNRMTVFSFIRDFYLFIDKVTNGSFFENAKTFSYKFLSSKIFLKYYEQDWDYRVYSPYDTVTDGDCIVFMINGFNQLSRRLHASDYIAVDFSTILNPFYRRVAWRVITSKPRRLASAALQQVIKHLLPQLTKIKRISTYPTPELNRFSIHDAISVVAYYENYCIQKKLKSFNNIMMYVRDFLRSANELGEIEVDTISYKILCNHRNSNQTSIATNTQLPKEDEITRIYNYLKDKAKDNLVYEQALIIYQITLQSELRISHTCSLLCDEVIYQPQTDSIIIKSTNKTSNGDKGEFVLGPEASRALNKALQINKLVRINCPQADIADHVFLYAIGEKYHVHTPSTFKRILQKACAECGIPTFTAKNLRAAYMTQAYINASQSGNLNEFTLKALSYHSKIKTTLEHYVNHSEALAALDESLKRGQDDWRQTSLEDRRIILENTLAEYEKLITHETNPVKIEKLRQEINKYRAELDSITYK